MDNNEQQQTQVLEKEIQKTKIEIFSQIFNTIYLKGTGLVVILTFMFFLSDPLPFLQINIAYKYIIGGYSLAILIFVLEFLYYRDIDKITFHYELKNVEKQDIKTIINKIILGIKKVFTLQTLKNVLQALKNVLKKALAWSTIKKAFSISISFDKHEKFLYAVMLLIVLSGLLTPAISDSILKYHINNGDIIKLSQSITDGQNDNYSKTIKLIEWQKSNVVNSFGIEWILLLSYGSTLYPHPQIDIPGGLNDSGNWTLINRIGACGANAYAFMQLANQNNIPVRVITIEGEDHVFDEVFIDGEWVVVDNTNNENGSYNISPQFYEGPHGWASLKKISYAYAIYPNSSIDTNVTYRYTNVSNLNIQVTDASGFPINNVTLKVFSNNRDEPSRKHKYTNLSGITGINGNYTFVLGDGDYTIEANNDTYSGKLENIILKENSNQSETIKLTEKIEKQTAYPQWVNDILKSVNDILNNNTFGRVLYAVLVSYIIVIFSRFLGTSFTEILSYGLCLTVLLILIKICFMIFLI